MVEADGDEVMAEVGAVDMAVMVVVTAVGGVATAVGCGAESVVKVIQFNF